MQKRFNLNHSQSWLFQTHIDTFLYGQSLFEGKMSRWRDERLDWDNIDIETVLTILEENYWDETVEIL